VFVLLGSALLETLIWVVLSAAPALAIVAWASTRPALVDGGVAHAERVHDGWIFGALLLAGAAVVAAGAYTFSRTALPAKRRRSLTRAAVVALVGAAVVVLAALVVRAGGPGDFVSARWHEFSNPAPVSEGASRLSAGSSNYRWTWWRQAWATFEDRPAKGSGAGSFELAHRLYRTTYSPPAREPHDLPLQVLSETGAVGLWLFLAAAVAAAIGITGMLRRRRGDPRSAAAALIACLVAYGVHVLVDSGWDYVALSGPVFFVIGLLLASPGGRAARRRPFAAVAVLAIAAVAVSSLATPWLAARRVDAAYTAYADGELAGAVGDARDARGLNPLSLDAVSTLALMQEARGQDRVAWRTYLDATDLQPLNPEVWYALGAFEVQTLHDCFHGYEHLNRSYTLDRFGPAGQAAGLLDQARASVNAGRARCG
jgi:O-antigen ligase